MKYRLLAICIVLCQVSFSQNIRLDKDTIYINDKSLLTSNSSHIKIFVGDTLTLDKPTKKSLLTYVYQHIDKINAGALLQLSLDERNGWKIIVEKITDKDNRIKIKGKLRNYFINKKGKRVEIGSETGVINDFEGALLVGEIKL